MKLGTVALAGLMTMGAIAATQFVMAQENQSTPVEPQQNDKRAAIARIDPKRPIQVRVISRTTVPVVASMVPAVGDRPVSPGKSVIFGRLHTSYLTLPIDLQVSLQETPDPDKPIRVYVEVKTAGNEIIVSVKTASTGDGNSSQTVSVDKKGAIYVF
ncbi:MAG: hypothetical protein LH647_02310 [Leptolyngbyaceae cyanobacterium CAN_BIN12]|nr:hypothetical protein [Leptolyngbyaceae cyanobacterium CAN_BIN12]